MPKIATENINQYKISNSTHSRALDKTPTNLPSQWVSLTSPIYWFWTVAGRNDILLPSHDLRI